MTTIESTALNLLTRDGAVCVSFAPALTSKQYDQLLGIVAQAATADELSRLLTNAAKVWQRQVVIDPC